MVVSGSSMLVDELGEEEEEEEESEGKDEGIEAVGEKR